MVYVIFNDRVLLLIAISVVYALMISIIIALFVKLHAYSYTLLYYIYICVHVYIHSTIPFEHYTQEYVIYITYAHSYLIPFYHTLSPYIHIQWTGKCIGKKNIAYFYAFLWVVAAHVAFVIAVTIYATVIGLHVYELQ